MIPCQCYLDFQVSKTCTGPPLGLQNEKNLIKVIILKQQRHNQLKTFPKMRFDFLCKNRYCFYFVCIIRNLKTYF